MFFILSKTVAFLLLPSNLLVVLALAGLALMATRWRCAGTRMMVVSLILLVAIGLSPAGDLLTYALESRFPPWDPVRGAPDGIVVLGAISRPSFHATTANRRSATMPRALSPWPSSREVIQMRA